MSDCLFCRIAGGDLGSNLVHNDDLVVAFPDINPQAPTHLLIVPKVHVSSVSDLTEAQDGVWARMMHTAQALARRELVDRKGYRLVVNAGENGGQTVPHLHMHLLGGRPMRWPPG